MKKLMILLTALILAFSVNAQDKTVSETIKTGHTYIDIDVDDSDTLTTNLDSVDFEIKYPSGEYIKKIAIHLGVDTIAGADTISVQLLGYDFADDATANTIIAVDTTNLTGANGEIILSDDYFTAADEFSFRYYVIRILHLGVGEGVEINQVEFKVYTE